MLVYNESQQRFEKISPSDDLKTFYECIQELLLWQGENIMDSEAGIDYFSVFNNRKLLRNELQRVLDKYRDSFNVTEIVSLGINDDRDVINVSISFQLPDNRNINVKLNPTLRKA